MDTDWLIIRKNPIFVRVVPNNQSKVTEIAKQDDDQRTNILGPSTIEVKPAFNTKQEKQLQGKNEEKSKINTKVDTKPFILRNEENKLEEKKREKKKEKSEIPEETNRENNKREEDKKGNTNKEEQKFPENIKRNEKRGENKEKGKNKGNDLLIETWKNKIPFEGVKYWNIENNVEKTNKFTPWNELSLLPILLQTAFEEFKIVSRDAERKANINIFKSKNYYFKALEKERQQNNFLKFNLKRNRKESNKEGLNREENECVDLAQNCLENNIFCGIRPYQELMKENCDCTCKIYLNKNKEEKIKSGENEEEIGSNSEEEASSEGENSEEENSLEEAKESEDDKDVIKKTECSDKSFRCERWAKRGFCENRLFNNDLKKRICANSCNLC
uniref:ShKT domain-containing protein n=1 Tax=Meloidogyne enterolobii TaxID=390850 RepID=A0A6V7VSX0_MELEN|nr:unnamed protein product [Meloidogyne enterolobii]